MNPWFGAYNGQYRPRGRTKYTYLQQEFSYSSGHSGAPLQQHLGPPAMPPQSFGEYGGAPGGSFEQALVPLGAAPLPFQQPYGVPGYGNTGFETRELYTRDGFGERYERYEACFPAPPIQPYIDEAPKLMAPRRKNPFEGYGNTGFKTRELYTRDGFGERYERYEACFPAPPIQPYIDEPPKLMAPRRKNYFDEQCSDESSASSKEESYHNFSNSEDSDNDSDDTNNGSEEDSDSESENSDNDSKHRKSTRNHRLSRATVASMSKSLKDLKVSGKSHKKKKRRH